MKKSILPLSLITAYLILFAVCAVSPFDRSVWIAENIPILLIVALLILTRRFFRFSGTAYLMMSVLIFMHTIGGHFTFERVPFDWVTDFFGFERNHYDRIAHFSVGFYAFAIAELLQKRRLTSSRVLLFLFPVFAIFTVASVYEIIEWTYADLASPESGAAFLGSQGDLWDAQKDMLADGLGALCATLFYFMVRKPEKKGSSPGSN